MVKSKRRHFGVLCSTIDIANQYDVWRGIIAVAAENDIHLTAYIGTYQSTDNNFYSYLESCYDTIFGSDTFLDGLILSSGFIAQNVGIEEYSKFTERIPHKMPMVSISYEIENIPAVVTYNKGGMFSAVEHMIKIHGKKHIAFIKGPEGHPEADARLQGYKEALKANGLPVDSRYIFPGDFGRETGRDAVNKTYDELGIKVEAFVCCNDQTAVGVLHCLKQRDIMVPGDVAVVGFDDDVISSRYVPSIATVGQDFAQLGRVAAELLIEQLDGIKADAVTYVIPEFIPRQSCGCLGQNIALAGTEVYEYVGVNTFSAYVETGLSDLLKSSVPRTQIKTWADMLVKALSCAPFERDEFLAVLDHILVTYYHSYSTEFSVWHKALVFMAKSVERYKENFENAYKILSTLTYATMFVIDIRMTEQRKIEYGLRDDRISRQRHTNVLLLMFDVDTLAKELYKSSKYLSLNTAFIGIFRNPVKRGAKDVSRTIETIIGFDGKDKIKISSTGSHPVSFSDYSSIEGFDYDRERRILIFQPLFVKDEEVGVMLVPHDPTLPSDTYETLRINISATLKGAQLISTIQTLSVTDELTGLYNRRGFFQFTYSRLYHLQRDSSVVPIVLFMDLDALKVINDTYGHNEGDIAIKTFAEILKSTMREEDIIGRIGGDEFAVLSSVRTGANATQLEERLRYAYTEYNAKKLHPYHIGASIGCVVLKEATRVCFEAAMLSADQVLYEEKMEKRKLGMSR